MESSLHESGQIGPRRFSPLHQMARLGPIRNDPTMIVISAGFQPRKAPINAPNKPTIR